MVAVCAAPDLAAALVAGGVHVLLCGTDGASLATTVISLRRTATRQMAPAAAATDTPTDAAMVAPPAETDAPRDAPSDAPTSTHSPTEATAGRIAVLVGDLGQPEVEAAARAMARELFGAEPVTVRTESEARQLLTGADRLEQARSGTFEPPFDSWSNPTP
jgi:hypothetical protein